MHGPTIRSPHSAVNTVSKDMGISMHTECLPTPTADIAAGLRNLDTLGFTIHRGFLDQDRVRHLRERVQRQAAGEIDCGMAAFAYDGEAAKSDSYLRPTIGRPHAEPGLQRIFFLVNKGREFIDLATHRTALIYANHALRGQPFIIGAHYALIVRNGAPHQPIHMAQPKLPFAITSPLSLMTMVALNDQRADMGATRVVAGSHKAPPREIDLAGADAMPVELAAGDALILDTRLWHGRGASTSPDPRYSIAILYGADFLMPPDFYPAAIHDDVYAAMSAEERRLYGFDPSCGGRIGPRYQGDARANLSHPLPFISALGSFDDKTVGSIEGH